ncbi:nucleoside 2-deoxyribosyltransferase [Weissella koreensis]|uniref:Nucleoside 2-deoxyribosyltransferase n=1 Tax=Weissella koreensis TaxID=165096 RepID=A0A7H1MMZ6_9LACO|nr:nucleoside 2-deoxyribosyltransferase [Weissella koreensis]AEJ24014.1 purine deoxyribosyltransferase [Weissella koreensis KACC 15510]AVH75628.1 nucleoside 2-deoxyribosyltransferase [Weissella koreensis]EJF34615.1 purine deoxyribosyltransferase [Weissella koreensis KCTC 3621]MCZ9311342.1 nucleoside 2-deoxyribosyltransferase [Weissella koreensis]QGN20851.1 nucleoside 2-deoxyribosyltransferase [Weissella koreensis]
MKNIYLAGPFFSDEQIARLERVEAALEKNPTVASFYSPFRHQLEDLEFGSKEWAEAVFDEDRRELHNSEVVVGIVDYQDEHVDPGTAWELGYAGMQEKPVIVFKEKDGGINIMISVPGHAFVKDATDLAEYDFDALPKGDWDGPVF